MESIKSDPENVAPLLRQEIMRLAEEYNFFHWHIAFPDVFPLTTSPSGHLTTSPNSGFDCILGNPPWERVKLQEKEFFSARDADIANAPNAAARKRMIDDLPTSNPLLYQAFLAEKRISEGSSLLIREGGRYPLCGRGDVNTYTVFAELNRKLLSERGYCGCIVPSGIATDDTTKFFFQDITDTGSLVSLYDFENREGIFPGVHRSYKFCLLTLRAPLATSPSGHLAISPSDFVFFAHSIADLSDTERHFQLSKDDIALINPNTRTCPIFRGKQDAELTKYIYRRVPVLINENDPEHGNPWGISFMRMFDMSNDSHLFKTKQQLEDMGFCLQGNSFVNGKTVFLPLYEAKMMHHFNHRFGDYADLPEGSDSTQLPDVPLSRLQNPEYEPLPRYWVEENKIPIGFNDSVVGFRRISNTTNERTFVTSILSKVAFGDNVFLMLTDYTSHMKAKLVSTMLSYACDFIVRQKMGGLNLNFFIAQQLAVLPPSVFQANVSPLTTSLSRHLTASNLELLYTSYSLQPFAQDCGYDGPPFIWDEERRFEIRCELDALFFHLYLGTDQEWRDGKGRDGEIASLRDTTSPSGHLTTSPSGHLTTYFPTPRHAVEYIMETFPIVKRKDEKEYGEYRTKRRILEIYDAMTPLFETTLLQASATTTSPSGHLAISPLDPPPGPPCDNEGNFIPVDKWDKNNWPKHIHVYIQE